LEADNKSLQEKQTELRQELVGKEKQINELKDANTMSSKLAEGKTQLESDKRGMCETINICHSF